MKIQETIETLKIAIAEVEWNYPMEYAVAFENAIESLEKQIPKKPIKKDLKNYWGDICDVGCCCPICNEIVCFEYEFQNKELYQYCYHCGQALDWSETK